MILQLLTFAHKTEYAVKQFVEWTVSSNECGAEITVAE